MISDVGCSISDLLNADLMSAEVGPDSYRESNAGCLVRNDLNADCGMPNADFRFRISG